MSGFGHYARTADELEREIYKRGLALGIDWDDQVRLRELARQALSSEPGNVMRLLRSPIRQDKLTGELFALSELMLNTMRQSAQIGVHTERRQGRGKPSVAPCTRSPRVWEEAGA